MTIVGVSFDAPEDNQAWKDAQGFGFELWSDTNRDLALHYGAASSTSQSWAARVTRLLDGEGTLVLEYAVTDIANHPQHVLEDCQVLFGD